MTRSKILYDSLGGFNNYCSKGEQLLHLPDGPFFVLKPTNSTKPIRKNELSHSVQIRNPYTNVLKTAKTVSLNCAMFGKGYVAETARIFGMHFCEHRDDIHVHTFKLLSHSRTHQQHCPQIK